jgi:hypothetical protein
MARKKSRITLALFLAVLPAVTAVQAARGAGRVTQVIRFVPRSPGRGMISGYCWTGSIAIDRPDAYRCMAGNEIYDPCLADRIEGYVVCNPNPAKGNPGTRMKLTKVLPAPEGQAGSLGGTWLVELADGTTCMPITGARGEIEGKTVSYYCEGGQKGTEIDLLGDLDTSGPLWTAQKATVVYTRSGGAKVINSRKEAVKRAWR